MKRVLAATFALLLTATIAGANDHGASGRGPDFGPGGDLIVASDGTIFLTTTTVSAGVATTQVRAVTSSGTAAWTITVNGRGRLVLSGNNLIAGSETTASDGSVSSTLTAYSTTTGSVSWTRTLTGLVAELVPFSGGTYAIVVTPSATSGGTATRSLVALGNDGSVLWTLAL